MVGRVKPVLLEYIYHRPGNRHQNADALSRTPDADSCPYYLDDVIHAPDQLWGMRLLQKDTSEIE